MAIDAYWFNTPSYWLYIRPEFVRVHHIDCRAADSLLKLITFGKSYDERRWKGPYQSYEDAMNDASSFNSNVLPCGSCRSRYPLKS